MRTIWHGKGFEDEAVALHLEVVVGGSVELLPVQKMTLGSGESDSVRIPGLPKACVSVVADASGGFFVRANEGGDRPLECADGSRVAEIPLSEGVVFCLGPARIRCFEAAPVAEPMQECPPRAEPLPGNEPLSFIEPIRSGEPHSSVLRNAHLRIRLRGRDPDGRSYRFEILEEDAGEGAEFIIGRDPRHCHIEITNDTVSPRHARLEVRGGCVWLEDLGSGNGTRVNRREIRAGDPPIAISKDDRIEFGEVALIAG